MPTLPTAPHQARQIAESFGIDPVRYHRVRPRYPRGLIDELVSAMPSRNVTHAGIRTGTDLLDVGIGTGVSAEPFRAAGRRVLGVEPDPHMAQFARAQGFDVEPGTFEAWDPAGRRFDAVISGMTWHWVDPLAGATKAAVLLRPGGLLALFWYVAQPPAALTAAFAQVYRRVLPGTPFAAASGDPVRGYQRLLDAAGTGIEATRAFGEPQRHRVDWKQHYTTEGWLDLVPTFGGHSTLPPGQLGELLSGIRAAVDQAGSRFTVRYAGLALTARIVPRG